jgi:xanthine dehydrogenase accessory factor
MPGIFEELGRLLRADERVATATVVRTQGSTPREVGAKMLIRPSGEIAGTIGGGCGEAEVWQAAMDALKDGHARLVTLDLTGDVALDTEMVCGGIMEVFVELWGYHDLELLQEANKAMEKSGRFVLITPISTDSKVARHLLLPGGQFTGTPGQEELDEQASSRALEALREGKSQTVPGTADHSAVFLDVQVAAPTLLVAGAGHIAVPLARFGHTLGFRVVVLDDRPMFANEERFPEADEVISAPFGETLAGYPLNDQTYVVLMTRGHAHDLECLVEVIDRPAAYIGMIGSRRRVRGVLDAVRERGISEELLARVHAPIGLDIGALTPEEIALSVMAEVVKARRGGTGRSLSEEDPSA